jgi:hypothetical protein
MMSNVTKVCSLEQLINAIDKVLLGIVREVSELQFLELLVLRDVTWFALQFGGSLLLLPELSASGP